MCEMIPIFMYSTIVERPVEGENRNKSSCTLFWGNTEFVNDTETENAIYSRRRLFSVYSFTLSYLIPLTAVWFFYSNIILRVWLRKSKFFSLQRQRTRRTTTKVYLTSFYKVRHLFTGHNNGASDCNIIHSSLLSILDVSMADRNWS